MGMDLLERSRQFQTDVWHLPNLCPSMHMSNTQAYPAGVNAAFKLVIFGFMIEVSVLIDSGSCDGEQDGNDKLATSLVGCTPGANPGIEAHVAVSPLKFGSWFELTSADGSEGPSLDVVFDTSVQEFAFTGRLKLGSLLHVQCEMEIALTKVMIKFDFTAAGGLSAVLPPCVCIRCVSSIDGYPLPSF